MRIIGIDPGINGGVAVYNMANGELSAYAMPATVRDLYDLLAPISSDAYAYLEKVGGRPGQSAPAAFTFGVNYGGILGILTALKIPTETVTPQKWQKTYQLDSSATASKSEWKNKLKAKAQQLSPRIKVTLKTADAILIALYGARQTPLNHAPNQ